MPTKQALVSVGSIDRLIYAVRGRRVMLDRDLAMLYGVETRVLNQAVRRNRERFPADFMLELTRKEILRISQIVIILGGAFVAADVRRPIPFRLQGSWSLLTLAATAQGPDHLFRNNSLCTSSWIRLRTP
ncbi:MAG: hypothetical protein DME19_04820 [Verrucomicrobia bacterium]|nr:MAG: hypothetical protein DME19_04820 [Verrucomicrobiota bacterium]